MTEEKRRLEAIGSEHEASEHEAWIGSEHEASAWRAQRERKRRGRMGSVVSGVGDLTCATY